MPHFSKKTILITFFLGTSLVLFSCDKDLTSSADEPELRYTLTVTDSATNAPLDSVQIAAISITDDTTNAVTGTDGRAVFVPIFSSRTLFTVSRNGYRTKEFLDSAARISSDDTSTHPPILRLLDVKLVSLKSILPDSLKPHLISGPADTVGPADTLRFAFSQRMVQFESARISVINIGSELYIKTAWDTAGKVLKIVLYEGDWQTGLRYEYVLKGRNGPGEYFTRLGDTMPEIRGQFFVRPSALPDTGIRVPQSARFAWFNSGDNSRFDSLDLLSTPLADSSSRFGRLRWTFAAGAGRKVDSLVVFFRDNGTAAPSWTRWLGLPAAVESVTVDFSDWYSLRPGASAKPLFPLRVDPSNATLQFRLVPKQGTVLRDTQAIQLPDITQGMGPSLWVSYDTLNGLNTGFNAVDTLEVAFRKGSGAGDSIYDFGTTRPMPVAKVNGIADSAKVQFEWITGQRGRLIYRFNGFPSLNTFIQADLNLIPHGGKPIWIRNRTAGITL